MDLADYGLEALHPGKRLRTRAGRSVTVGAPLGAGNEGLVLRGEMDGKAVAVKVLRPDRTGTRLERTRALVAKQLASSVDAHIAGPFDQLDFNGRAGHISWLVPGTDVAALPDLPMLLNSRQRVMATIRLGVLLAKIHRAGMAFGDLNKGAVRVLPAGEQDAEVYLVDLDSAVLRGVPLPPTLGAPDTAAPELRRGEQPGRWRAGELRTGQPTAIWPSSCCLPKRPAVAFTTPRIRSTRSWTFRRSWAATCKASGSTAARGCQAWCCQGKSGVCWPDCSAATQR